jgi:hypothetical protein
MALPKVLCMRSRRAGLTIGAAITAIFAAECAKACHIRCGREADIIRKQAL